MPVIWTTSFSNSQPDLVCLGWLRVNDAAVFPHLLLAAQFGVQMCQVYVPVAKACVLPQLRQVRSTPMSPASAQARVKLFGLTVAGGKPQSSTAGLDLVPITAAHEPVEVTTKALKVATEMPAAARAARPRLEDLFIVAT